MYLNNEGLIRGLSKVAFPLMSWGRRNGDSSIFKVDERTRFKLRANTSDLFVVLEIWGLKVYDDAKFTIKPQDVIVDIGAHIGVFAVRAAQRAFQGQVFAYEASRQNYDVLVENCGLNRLMNLHAHNVAVWDRAGTMELSFPDSNGAFASLMQESSADRETVAATTLDMLVERNKLDHIDLLKIDAEGAEYPILFGCSDETLRKIRCLVLEYHDYEDGKWGHEDLERFLKSKGFQVTTAPGILLGGFLFGTGCLKAWRAN
ncbi:MAG: FkbM family methyltransferase [Chloroflexota bacterium]|nr:FkbM family methyltransferase [Chloroflexota bacterium]